LVENSTDMREKRSPLNLDECCSRQCSKCDARKNKEDNSRDKVYGDECYCCECCDYVKNFPQYG